MAITLAKLSRDNRPLRGAASRFRRMPWQALPENARTAAVGVPG